MSDCLIKDKFLVDLIYHYDGKMYMSRPVEKRILFYKNYIFRSMGAEKWYEFLSQLNKQYFMVSTHAYSWASLPKRILHMFPEKIVIEMGKAGDGINEPAEYCMFFIYHNPFNKYKEKQTRPFYFDVNELVKDF